MNTDVQHSESTLDPIQRPIVLGNLPIYDDGTGFNQLQDYKTNSQGGDSGDSSVSILKQSRSDFITTGLISADQRKKELDSITVEANEIVDATFKERNKGIQDLTLKEILTNTSDTAVGIVHDLTNKPKQVNWLEHLKVTVTKDQRYMYIGILLLFFGVYLGLMKL